MLHDMMILRKQPVKEALPWSPPITAGMEKPVQKAD